MADIFTSTLSKPVTPDALRALRASVHSALEDGTMSVVIDIDDVGTLDSTTIAALIVLLRAARERGAALALRVGRKNLLETLHITALDRVFPLVTPLESAREERRPGPARSPHAGSKRGRGAALVAAALLSFTFACRSSASAAPPARPTERGFDLSLVGEESLWSYSHGSLETKVKQ